MNYSRPLRLVVTCQGSESSLLHVWNIAPPKIGIQPVARFWYDGVQPYGLRFVNFSQCITSRVLVQASGRSCGNKDRKTEDWMRIPELENMPRRWCAWRRKAKTQRGCVDHRSEHSCMYSLFTIDRVDPAHGLCMGVCSRKFALVPIQRFLSDIFHAAFSCPVAPGGAGAG
jgi:hypothetical protein